MELLLNTLSILQKKYPSLKLVLTGKLADVTELVILSQDLGIENSIICTGRLSLAQLYSCYKYAACTPVPTMHEAGFSWQAVEAMSVDTPVVLTDADMYRDEIENIEMADRIPLIPGDDAVLYANEIEFVMKNREFAVKRQKPLFKALTKRTWNDAAREYYEMFEELL
jgi:glycosyltransferase involved in cell wall biosynthesis